MLIELGCAELGVARQVANLPELPAVLTARSRDRVNVETGGPSVELSLARLRARGLVDPRGALCADLHQAIDSFAHAPFEVDVRFAAGRLPEVRAVMTAVAGIAMLGVVTAGHVRFSRLPAEGGLPALVDVLPPVEPARGTSVTLPVAEVDAAVTDAMAAGAMAAGASAGGLPQAHRDVDDGVVGGLTARGVAGVDARLFVSLMGSKRLRLAEFGVTVRDADGRRRRSSRTVQAIDMRRGRAVLYTRGEYVVAAPADRATVVRALADLRDAELRGTQRPRSG